MWLDNEERLVENRNRDTWQLPVVTTEGSSIGHVIGQVVQPGHCMVRYFIVFAPESDRHILIPSDTVHTIDDQVVCTLDVDKVEQLPPFDYAISRDYEQEVYRILARRPYWER